MPDRSPELGLSVSPDGSARVAELEAELARARNDIRQLEQSLDSARRNEARLQHLCDQSPLRMGIVELLDDDAEDLRVLWVNRAFLDFYRTTLDNVVGKTGSQMGASRESRLLWLDGYRRAWRIQQPVTVEIFEVRHDSWIQATLAPLADLRHEGLNSPRRLAFCVLNITRRKKSEEALKQSQERWQFVLDQLPATVWVLDDQLRFQFTFGRNLEAFGLEPDAIVGRSLTEFLKTEDEDYLPLASHLRSLKGEEQSFPLEWRGRHYTCHTRPSHDLNGTIDGVIGIALDITDRKLAEASLRESELRFRMLFENSPDAIFVEDRNGVVLDVNQAACDLHGLSRTELIGRNVRDLIPPDTRADQWERYRRLIAGEIRQLTSTSLRADGTIVPIELTAGHILIDGAHCLLLHVRDISDRQNTEALERKMLEAQKLESLGVLAGGIAHDFNNLLAVILGNASLLQSHIPVGSPLAVHLEPIIRTSERAAGLCKQMLAYSGRGKFTIEPVDLNDVVREMAGLLGLSVPKKVTLSTRLADSLPLIEADGTQLRQLVMNLILNAAEAIGDQAGTIGLSTSLSPDRRVLLEVADSGCGMDESTRAKIFDPFYTTKFTGRGLGLATVQGIVRGHRGTIEVESALGRGSCFRVAFPAADHLEPIEDLDSGPPSEEFVRSGRILVVDDEPGIRNVVSRMLKAIGYEATIAVDGEDGLDQFRVDPDAFVLVLLDLTMPRLNGEETFRQLHQLRPELPVIIMSGYSEQEAASKFLGANVADFITKPFTISRLETKIHDALRLP